METKLKENLMFSAFDFNGKFYVIYYLEGLVPCNNINKELKIVKISEIFPNNELNEYEINEFIKIINMFNDIIGGTIHNKYEEIFSSEQIQKFLEEYIKMLKEFKILESKFYYCLNQIKSDEFSNDSIVKIFEIIIKEIKILAKENLLYNLKKDFSEYFTLKVKEHNSKTLYSSNAYKKLYRIKNEFFNTIKFNLISFEKDNMNAIRIPINLYYEVGKEKLENFFEKYFPFYIIFEKDETESTLHKEEIFEDSFFGCGSHNNGPWPTGKFHEVGHPYSLNDVYFKYNLKQIINSLKNQYYQKNNSKDNNIGIDWCKRLEKNN